MIILPDYSPWGSGGARPSSTFWTSDGFLARHVAPWLKAREPWCLGTIRLPDGSLLNTATSHYAVTDPAGTASFNRRDNRIDGAAAQLPRLHLNYEMVGQWRLRDQDIRGSVLIVEHPKRLTTDDVSALKQYVRNGGTLLLTGMGLTHGRGQLLPVFGLANVVGPRAAEQLNVELPNGGHTFEHHLFRFDMAGTQPALTVVDAEKRAHPLLTQHTFGRGAAWYFATPLLTSHGQNVIPPAVMRAVFDHILPEHRRQITTNAPETVEIVLRAKGRDRILHLVNMAAGTRDVYRAGTRSYVKLTALPSVPASRIHLRTPRRPLDITLQPQNKRLDDWQYVDGCVEANIPAFDVHQMVVARLSK